MRSVQGDFLVRLFRSGPQRPLLLVCALGAVLLAWSGRANAAAALVHRGNNAGTTSVAVNWQTLAGVNTTTTAGNLLVAIVQYNQGSTVTAPAGWTFINSAAVSTAVDTAVYYIENNAGGRASETFTFGS